MGKTSYDITRAQLHSTPVKWLVTGVAGFIGSNLLQTLLELDQQVVGLDNFATGHRENLAQVERTVGHVRWARFQLIDGDIRDISKCNLACSGVKYVLHQAALGSVPRSIEDPLTSNASNVDGFLNMLVAARDAKVASFVYAASSSTYGDHPALPKVEDQIGRPLSPYAVTKLVNELYADVFWRTYGLNTVGLRYFNVFGRRQDPNGAYAAVIPRWIAAMIAGEKIYINGDGETSRDFCYVDNAVQANLLAATAPTSELNQIYNVAVGDRTTLGELFAIIRDCLSREGITYASPPVHRDFRRGDVRHSLADIGKSRSRLGYEPSHHIEQGLAETVAWYCRTISNRTQQSTS